MKTAIVALLAGSAAAFAPASVNKVRDHIHSIGLSHADRTMTSFRERLCRDGWAQEAGRRAAL